MRLSKLSILCLIVGFAGTPSLVCAEEDGVGYDTPQAAWDALSVKPGVEVAEYPEWRVINDSANLTLWTFTKPGTSAHPSVVKRWAFEKDGAWYSQMRIRCGASKSQCDHLRDQFVAMDKRENERVKSTLDPKN